MKLEKIIAKLTPVKNFVSHYAVLMFIAGVVIVLAYMTYSIAHYSNVEPSELQINEKKASLKVVKLNDAAVKKIQELQDKNISIESLFNNGRANPFE